MWPKLKVRRLKSRGGKILLFLFFAAFLMEISLRIYASLTMSHESFAHFLQESTQKIRSVNKREVIYCVGDSTVQGLGASEPELYSMPAQLQNFIHQVAPFVSVVNLGYAGTCTEEHLKMLRLLPTGARVIYRGGISDKWNQSGDGFRFRFGKMVVESRLLRMFAILFPGVFRSSVEQRALLIQRELESIQSRQKLQIVSVDYTTYAEAVHLKPFYLSERIFPNIALNTILTEHNFMSEGVFQKSYVSVTGTHPNELGYYIEALFIFNQLCQQGLFGFLPEQAVSLDNVQNFSFGLKERYTELKLVLKGRQFDDLYRSGQRELLRNMVKELWFLADLLSSLPAAEKNFSPEKHALERLSLFVFHDFRLIFTALAGLQSIPYQPQSQLWQDAQMKASQYYTLLHFLVPPKAPSWHKLQQNIAALPFAVPTPSGHISLLPDFYPYPLEFCPRFMKESAGFMPDVQTEADWNYFFNIPYQRFLELDFDFCH